MHILDILLCRLGYFVEEAEAHLTMKMTLLSQKSTKSTVLSDFSNVLFDRNDAFLNTCLSVYVASTKMEKSATKYFLILKAPSLLKKIVMKTMSRIKNAITIYTFGEG